MFKHIKGHMKSANFTVGLHRPIWAIQLDDSHKPALLSTSQRPRNTDDRRLIIRIHGERNA
jgi:hypothetical protein